MRRASVVNHTAVEAYALCIGVVFFVLGYCFASIRHYRKLENYYAYQIKKAEDEADLAEVDDEILRILNISNIAPPDDIEPK